MPAERREPYTISSEVGKNSWLAADSRLWSASNQLIKTCGAFQLFVLLGDLLFRLLFGPVNILPVSSLLEGAYQQTRTQDFSSGSPNGLNPFLNSCTSWVFHACQDIGNPCSSWPLWSGLVICPNCQIWETGRLVFACFWIVEVLYISLYLFINPRRNIWQRLDDCDQPNCAKIMNITSHQGYNERHTWSFIFHRCCELLENPRTYAEKIDHYNKFAPTKNSSFASKYGLSDKNWKIAWSRDNNPPL